MDFLNKANFDIALESTLLTSLGENLTSEEIARLRNFRTNFNFFEGYHWEQLPDTGKTEVTKNYCRAFVDKFVSYEFGKGFNIRMKPDIEGEILPFLNEVWENNNKLRICQELGQAKSVTGIGWLQVAFEPKYLDSECTQLNPKFDDPYGEYDKGRIRVLSVPPNIVFPTYADGYDRDKLVEVRVMYPITKGKTKVVYKQVWTKDSFEEWEGKTRITSLPNPYGVIPFFPIPNLVLTGSNFGISDLEDIIPLNVELNLKSSDVSEIIDYHSAPTTVIFGANIDQLERGANKVWGGMPKDGRVENLTLGGDLRASTNYIADIKKALHEVGQIPEQSLGGEVAISNTSGVALQVIMQPLLEKVARKRALTGEALQKVNKLIIKIGLEQGIIKGNLDKWKNGDTYAKDLYQNEIIWEDSLPKDKLVEIQAIQLEMKLGLEDRAGGMKRLGKRDIQTRLKEIEEDRRNYPEVYGLPSELEQEAMKTNLDVKVKSQKEGLDIMKRPLNVNKAGNSAEVNPGLQNSPIKKQETNS